jgi:hypothetical protein
MQFHVQGEEPETAILTVPSRVFDACSPKFICTIKNACEISFLDDYQEQQAECECFPALITVRARKVRANQVACVFGALFRCARTLTRITSGLHLHVDMSLFVRSTVCSSVLVLKMRCSAAAAAHKSWPS